MSRIRQALENARRERGGGFIPYVVAGDPDRERSLSILAALAGAGADVLEIGVPWSDPIADGPENQMAMQRARGAGMTLAGTLDLVASLRRQSQTPVVLMSYGNPIHRMGTGRFVAEAARVGIDGLLVTDLPPEDWGELGQAARGAGIDMIALCSPTTPVTRARELMARTSGFLYVVARLGVTGMGIALDEELESRLAMVRGGGKASAMPVAVGFGISTRDDVCRVLRVADAFVVGSALSAAIRRAVEEKSDPALAVRQRAVELCGA